MSFSSDPEAQPRHEVQPSKQRSNVSAYTKYTPPIEIHEEPQTVMANIAKGLHSPEFQAFVSLVGKDAASGYLRRVLDNKKG